MNVLLVLSFIAACIISTEIESFPTIVDKLNEEVMRINQKKSIFKNLTEDDKFNLYVMLERDKEVLQKDKEVLQKDKEVLQKDKEVLQKDKEVLQKGNEDLNKSLVSETNLRLHYQSLLDFTELIKGLVEEGYPIWAKPRDDHEFSDKIFETMFLNVENRRILLLKIALAHSGVSEKDFIKMVQDFLRFRHIDVHKPLSNTQREKAYPELIRNANEKQKTVISSILQYSYNVDVKSGKVETQPDAVPKFFTSQPLPTTVNPKDLPLADIIIRKTDELRKNRKFMVITNPQTWMLNEDQLQKVSSTDQLPEDAPLACYVPNKDTAYILFKSFKNAYNALQNLKREEECNLDTDKAKPKYLIRTIHDFVLNDKNKKCELKLEIYDKNSNFKSTTKPNTNVAELMTMVKTYLENIYPEIMYQIMTRKQKNHEVFLRFSNAEKLLKAYEILKKASISATVTIFAQNLEIEPSTVNVNVLN